MNKRKNIQILVREYDPEDVEALASIYYNTIHIINRKDYTQEQVNVWAPTSSLNPEGWRKKFERTRPLVAVCNEKIVGFAELEPNGHIDSFYCHHEWIRQGVGSALMQKIERIAYEKKISSLFAEVSITARPFFEHNGFSVSESQIITRKGVNLMNYKMEKKIPFH